MLLMQEDAVQEEEEGGGRMGGQPVPVVGQQAVTEHEPAPLVALQVVGPFEEPALAGVHTRQVEPGERRGRQPLHQLVHAASCFLSPGGGAAAEAEAEAKAEARADAKLPLACSCWARAVLASSLAAPAPGS